MDPSRHREYIASNEERSRLHTSAAYYSRDIPDVAAHRYYGSSTAAVQPTTHPPPPPPGGPARSHSNTRISCDCTTTPSGARITCNNCRLNPNGDMWPSASSTSSSSNSGPAANEYHMHREYRQMTTSEATMRTGMRQSSMYMHQQQQQPPPAPPPASNPAAQHMPAGLMQHPGGHPPPPPTSSQSIMQTHTISRTNYWPQNPSSTSQHYGEEHIHGPGPGPGHHPHAHHQQQQQHAAVVPPPHQATTTQTQIDSSITRRPAANALGPNGAPLDAGNMYGQYKSVSHPSHSGSSYPAQQPAPPQPSSTNPVHHQQQQHQPQQRVSAIGGGSSGQTPPIIGASNSHYITKEQRVYQTKYSSTTTTTKIAYNATATSTAVYDSHHPQHVGSANKTSSASLPIDHHVINPSNLPNSKEQHPSPNYARKCPQMYTPETAAEQSTVHQHHHHHHNLYMTTPQFSSDKFSRASPQQLPTSDYTKLRESPSGAGGASPYMVSSGDNKYSHIPPSPSSSHLRESPQFVSSPQAPPRNANAYYNNSNPPNHHHHQHPPPPAAASSKVHPPEMSPIIMKQSPHPHYQYSRSPLQPPPSAAALPPSASHSQLHQMPGNKMSSNAPAAGGGLAAPPPPPGNPPPLSSSQRYLMDNVKREDLEIYESSPQHQARGSTVGGAAAAGSAGIYINPYNTPPPTGGDSCCKEVTASSPYTIVGSATPNYRVESPQFYGTKYGKMSTTTGSEKHAALLQQNTPPPSRAPSQRGGHPGGQPAAYYYDGNPHSAPSPAAATAASPSPSSALLASSTTTSQTHIHHTEYVTTTIQGPAGHAMPPQSSYPPSQPMGQHHQAAGLRNTEMLPYERAMPPLQNHAQPPAGMKHGGHTSTMVPVQQNVSSVPSSQHHNASKIPVNPVGGGSSKNKPNYRELITRQLAMRNATSEEELNLQIIKKTLNVDSQNIRVPPGGPAGNVAQSNLAPNARGVIGGPAALHQPPAIVGGPPAGVPLLQPQPSNLPLQNSKLASHHTTTAAAAVPRPAEPSRIFIKQEDDKPSSSSSSAAPSSGPTTTTSPLDLSMRTVKTKADSTEYKYQQRRSTPNLSNVASSSVGGGYTLPRVDSTPVFSVHAFEPGAPTSVVDITGSGRRPSPHSSRHNSLERSSRNYTPPTQPSPQNSRHNSLERSRNYTPPSQPRDIVMTPTHSNSVSPIGSSSSTYPHPAERHSSSPYTPRRSVGEINPTMTAPGSPHIKTGSSTSTLSSMYDPAAPSSCIIKAAPKTERDLPRHTIPQARPSVLETNPYAASVIKTEPTKRMPLEGGSLTVSASPSSSASSSTTHHTLAAVERLPPDTSIMPLPLKSSYGLSSKPSAIMAPKQDSPSPVNTSQGCERNPNFRKRHIQEYSHQMSASGEPMIKQSRYLDSNTSPGVGHTMASKPIIPMRPADISVIAVNESNQHELLAERNLGSGGVIATAASIAKNQAPVIVNNFNHCNSKTLPPPIATADSSGAVVCKQEPLTPTGMADASLTPKLETAIAQQPPSQPRIRTKAELKGFTFNPPPPTVDVKPSEPPSPTAPVAAAAAAEVVVNIKQESPPPEVTPTSTPVKIKVEEPESTVMEEIEAIPGLEDDFSGKNLLDFGWSNTCNNFVEQLITRPAKKSIMPGLVNKAITTPAAVPKESCVDNAATASNDAGKAKLNNYSNIESAADTTTTRSSFPHFDGGIDSGMKSSSVNQDPLNSPSSSTAGMMHKKLNKLGREKKRYQQEKRLAERLQSNKDSSSETEDELDKRKTERLKKPLMKAKNKLKSKTNSNASNNDNNSSSTQVNDKNQFSDCGSDSSSSEESEEKEKSKMPPTTVAAKKEISMKVNNVQDIKGCEKKSIKEEEDDKQQNKDLAKSKTTEKQEKGSKKDIKVEKEDKTKDNKKSPGKSTESETKKPADSGSPSSSSSSSAAASSASSSSSSSESDNAKDKETKEKTKTTTNASSNKKSNEISSKTIGKFKISLNTMTRSKRKKEMEAQMANSKVLRNDKIIRNSTSKIKRKYVRKYVNNVNSYQESGGLTRESGVIKSARLKAKLERKVLALNHLKGKDKGKVNNNNNNNNKLKASTTATPKEVQNAQTVTPPTKGAKTENLHDPNVLELYRFKRALKVPPSLISIKHPAAHKIAASLPDLERHASALDAYAKKKKKINLKSHKNDKNGSGKSKTTNEKEGPASGGQQKDDEPRSIIDLLHSRVTKASGLNVSNKSTTTTASKTAASAAANSTTPKTSSTTSTSLSCVIGKNYANSSNNCGMFSETSQTTESSELQMLPPIKPSSDEDDDDDNESATSGKKRHFSIFETTVLPTKTRTESKMQQKRENIREIFVGDDRPASAPPEMTQAPDNGGSGGGGGIEKMTYEQTYEQFLQQMNIVISSDKTGRFSRTAGARKLLLPTTTNSQNANSNNSTSLNIKQEEVDTESTSVMDPDELKDDQKSETTHTIRKKRGKYLRRKGSSGFDYIRKKKKPSSSSVSNAMHNHNSSHNSAYHNFSIKNEKMEADEYENKVKTEDDVSREIQKWVLNKGVGQSTMHKAARQGYIDVVVYCLERMNMNPDQKDNAGYTPLHEACTNGWLDIARVLLQYGANHSAAAHSGIRPLHEASENDHEEIVRLLLAYGADPLLATYSGQTPLMLASSTTMRDILNNHLIDVQSMGPERKPWKFNGPWEIYDPSECGYNVFEGAPNPLCDTSRAPFLRKGSSSSTSLATNNQMMQNKKQIVLNNTAATTANKNSTLDAATTNSNNSQQVVVQNGPTKSENNNSTSTVNSCSGSGSSTSNNTEALKATGGGGISEASHHHKGETTTKTVMDKCAVVLDKIDHFNTVQMKSAVGGSSSSSGSNNNTKSEILVENSDSDGEMFEFEEADILLPPLYLLKDEGTTDKWVLLSDLCNLLKVKSKDTLLNKIYPQSSSAASAHKSLMRELKMSDFLEKATCLQLLCAGEKLNICASKVVLIKYNENVRNLLGVKTILMKF
uniref:Uncharacterized protein n=1 Tax=Musca domestica TaxID=7370 RepID=A0A1I8MLB3_MUSDO